MNSTPLASVWRCFQGGQTVTDHPHIGSDFDDFLAEEGLLESAGALAIKRVVAWQIREAMKAQKLSKKAMAERMGTSRAALDRVLDENDPGMTLATLARAARALGKRVEIKVS
ncbi:MAG TPA: helix-turn-helix transcriptional regulator [Plasticicumulans sp.]|nr:XRE family transcriptional regulator [Pseudomonadota bacterium]HMV38286.1 helix-turn-helix transcriptional regulator [Plasticicumulans sp.]HMW41902.1 helix-turn-helix transcriptional regulator [Plasticicumulans sp.]HMX53114.1 helix-turn-helix transcriptional regulator [Plasticicumulans sp.]HNB90216.1 helix-turn-helix transcriptional regulator [Plasticicumulans sp.]